MRFCVVKCLVMFKRALIKRAIISNIKKNIPYIKNFQMKKYVDLKKMNKTNNKTNVLI